MEVDHRAVHQVGQILLHQDVPARIAECKKSHSTDCVSNRLETGANPMINELQRHE
jgi:hypothetical protein